MPPEHRGIPNVCLVEFRARLVKAGMEGWLDQRLFGVAEQAGVIGRRRVVDSTGIADSVVTKDTVSLIRSAIRPGLGLLEEIAPERPGRAGSPSARDDYDRRARRRCTTACNRRFSGAAGTTPPAQNRAAASHTSGRIRADGW